MPRLPARRSIPAHLPARLDPPADVVAILKGHTDVVAAVAVSPDGKRIATGSFDKTAKLWDAATGKELRTYGDPQGHQGQVLAVAFAPTGDLLATGGADNVARLWAVPSGGPAGWFAVPEAVAQAAADKPVKTLAHLNLVDAVAFDPTGGLLATGCHDGNLRIWDVAKGQAVKTVPAHVQTGLQTVAHPIYCVAWAPGGKQVLTTSFDGSMKLWDAAAGTLVREFKAAPVPTAGGKVEPAKGPVGHRDQVFAAAFSASGKLIASGSSDRTVKLWDVATGAVVRDFPGQGSGGEQRATGGPPPAHPGWVHAVRFTPDDRFVVSAGPAPRGRGFVAVWSAADGKRVAGGERDTGPVHALAVTPDGTKLVLGCGPKSRGDAEADAVVVKMPGK